MAHEGIFATSDEILVKAGASVSSAGATEARINALALQVESHINVRARRDFSAAWATLDPKVRGILSEIESNLVAMYLIQYDPSTYDSLAEAQTMLDVLRDRAEKLLNLLEKDKKIETFIDKV